MVAVTRRQRTKAAAAGTRRWGRAGVAGRAVVAGRSQCRRQRPRELRLLAGRGGLNLTHSEGAAGVSQPGTARHGIAACAAIDATPPDALRAWSEALGQPTFVGSSGRVFPQAFKASPLLRAWLRRLDASGVQFTLRHRWTGWNEDGRFRLRRPKERGLLTQARPCSRSAAQAGRGSAPTGRGWKRWPRRAWRYRRCGRPIAALPSPGPRSSAIASKAIRSRV